MKCAYKKCDGLNELEGGSAGITDAKMRPWHHKCAREALTESQHSTLIAVAIFVTNIVILLTLIIFRQC